jgi:hypothetical protein
MGDVIDLLEYREKRAESELERELRASLEHCPACGRLAFTHTPAQALLCVSVPPKQGT